MTNQETLNEIASYSEAVLTQYAWHFTSEENIKLMLDEMNDFCEELKIAGKITNYTNVFNDNILESNIDGKTYQTTYHKTDSSIYSIN